MEQRTLRLGDIVDDYCPRERRLTNHAIVAMVDDVIRQTRCTTCDAEHIYKGGHAPRRRLVKPGAPGQPADAGAPATARAPGDPSPPGDEAIPMAAAADEAVPDDNGSNGSDEAPAESGDRESSTDLWVGHRPLIRATLPRVEGEQPAVPRPIPEFTMHQRHGRGESFRYNHGQPRGDQQPWSNGNGHPRGQFREGRGGQGQGGPPAGPGGPPGQRAGRRRRRRGGKKSH